MVMHAMTTSPSLELVDKGLVGRRFSASASSYDRYALAQHHIYGVLAGLIEAHRGRTWHHVLEIGCGTGGFSKYLDERHKILRWTLNDLEAHMIRSGGFEPRLGEAPELIIGDAETIDLGRGYDLIVSASAIQWLHDPRAFVGRLYDLLEPGGVLLISTFGPHNLSEIRALTGHGLHYPPLEEVAQWLPEAQTQVSQEVYPLTFASPREVLLHLKRTGVTGTSDSAGFWTAQKLRQFEHDYLAHYPHGTGVRLSYHPIYLVAERPLA